MSISVTLQPLPDLADAEELSELTTSLRQALSGAVPDGITIEMPVPYTRHGISMERSGSVPIEILLVSLSSAQTLKAVIKTIETWVASRRCSVRIKAGDTEVDIEGDVKKHHKEIEELLASLQSDSAKD